MCGFTGFVNIKEKLNENSKTILENMNGTLRKEDLMKMVTLPQIMPT